MRIQAAWRDPTDLSALVKIMRHPWIVCCVAAISMMAAYGYTRLVVPRYSSTTLLRLRQGSPMLLGAADPARTSEETASYLNAELVVLNSCSVIERAMAAQPDLKAIVAKAPDPIAEFRKGLHVNVGRKDGIISIEFEAVSPERAAFAANALAEAYIAHLSEQEAQTDSRMRAILAKLKNESDTALHDAMDGMLRLRREGMTTGNGQERAGDLATINRDLRAAEVDEAAARTNYEIATASLVRDSNAKVDFERMVASRLLTGSEAEEAQTRLAIQELELNVGEYGKQKYLSSHPLVVAVHERLDRLRAVYAASAYARWLQAHARLEKLVTAAKDQEAANRTQSERVAQYAHAEADVQRMDRYVGVLNERMQELKAREASGALQVTVVDRARRPLVPSKPDVQRIMVLAAAIGVVLGAFAAHARESSQTPGTQSDRQFTPVLALERRQTASNGIVTDLPVVRDLAAPKRHDDTGSLHRDAVG